MHTKQILKAKQAAANPRKPKARPLVITKEADPTTDNEDDLDLKEHHGFVQNAFLGGNPWTDLNRNKALPELSAKYSYAQRRYGRLMPDFIQCAECISHETGCWLYVILDHPGVAKPVTFFYSPRLCKDGGQAVLDVHRQMCLTFGGLKCSLKQANADMATKLQEKEEDLKSRDARIRELEALLQQRELVPSQEF